MSQENASQTTPTSLPMPRPATPDDLIPYATTTIFQTQSGGQLALVPVGATYTGPSTQISAMGGPPPTPSPEPLPVPPPTGPPNHPNNIAYSTGPHSTNLQHASGHRNEEGPLRKLWENSRRLGDYHTIHGEYPPNFRGPGFTKLAFIAEKLAKLPTPPTNILEFMTSYEVTCKLDNMLQNYLWRARTNLDNLAPTPLPQGDTMPNTPEAKGDTLADNEDKGLGQNRTIEGVKENVDESDSDKENDSEHPGHGWIRYDDENPECYPIWIPAPGEIHEMRAVYIRYVFDGEDTILEGTFGKSFPTYHQQLRARKADSHPNLSNDKDI
jgi:hypothetical protein